MLVRSIYQNPPFLQLPSYAFFALIFNSYKNQCEGHNVSFNNHLFFEDGQHAYWVLQSHFLSWWGGEGEEGFRTLVLDLENALKKVDIFLIISDPCLEEVWDFSVCEQPKEKCDQLPGFPIAVRPQGVIIWDSEISSYIIAFVFKSAFTKSILLLLTALGRKQEKPSEVRCLV